MSTPIQIVTDSFARCAGRDLLGRFYDIFLKSDPRIAQKFSRTDFEKQKELLTHSIQLAILYYDGKIAGKTGLARIRESHSRAKMDIAPGLYSFWKRSFLQAVSQTDSVASQECIAAWDGVLQKAIDYIVSGYDETPKKG